MASGMATLVVPLDVMIEAIKNLSLDDQYKLLEVLDAQVAEAEEEVWEQDPAIQARIQAARDAFQSGDYITLDELLLEQDED